MPLPVELSVHAVNVDETAVYKGRISDPLDQLGYIESVKSLRIESQEEQVLFLPGYSLVFGSPGGCRWTAHTTEQSSCYCSSTVVSHALTS